ncbi:MAG: hypothetical protein KGL95_11550, partial [Patescibacteria group bacterium]|nr:hypothetical protein [Patescibacteria group bacterium]
ANTESILQENTWYFPGWAVFDNNKQIPSFITSGTHPGLVRFLVLPGTHIVTFVFLDTWDRIIGNGASFLTTILCAIVFILNLVISQKKAYSVKKKK